MPTKKTTHGGKRPGAGRPKGSTKANPLARQIAVRLDEAMAAAFVELARTRGMTASDLLRLLVEQELLRQR